MDPHELITAVGGITAQSAEERDRAAADHVSQFQWNPGGHTFHETLADAFRAQDLEAGKSWAERGDVLDEFFGPRRWVTVPPDIDAPAQRSTVDVVEEARRFQRMQGISTPDPIVEKARRLVRDRRASGGLRTRSDESHPSWYYR